MEKTALKEQISLTAEEVKIFELLKEAQTNLEQKVVMRVAGGWVRDKVGVHYTSCSARSPWT